MAKKELFKNPLLRWLIVSLGAFPIDRGQGDTEAIKSAFKILKGDTLGIFPGAQDPKRASWENFSRARRLLQFGPKSPLPVYIRGKFRIFHRNYIVIGEPVDMTLDAGIEPGNIRAAKEGAEYLKQRIEELEALSNAIVGKKHEGDIGETRGFCFGVKRAVEQASYLAEQGKKSCVRWDGSYNASVVERLEKGESAVLTPSTR